MGTSEPVPVDEEGFHKEIGTGQTLMVASGGLLLVILIVIAVRAIRKKRRPQLSLGLLLLVTVAAGGCVLSGLHWRQSTRGLQAARMAFAATKARYDDAVPDEKPAHAITLTKPYYMGKFVVTQREYQAVIGANPSQFKGNDNPAETVSWDDVDAFCKKVTEQTKQSVRLPTEAEWEFACRAGTITTYHSGDTDADMARAGWYDANSKGKTHPVGQKEPNAFGLYDMHGNVCQWCRDWYGEDYYGKSEAENPGGPVQGTDRLLRGGSSGYSAWGCRAVVRSGGGPGYRVQDIGFRVVLPAFRTP
jgi:formylglycine-generating enzyme required for sulfatase activity